MSVLWKTIILLSLVALIGAIGRDSTEARRGSENGKKTDGNNSYWCPKFKAFTLESSPQRYRARAELTGDTAQH
jgi:hypothetical protein